MSYSGVKYKKYATLRKFGVELEVGGPAKSRICALMKPMTPAGVFTGRYQASVGNTAYWHVKDDATCGPNGRTGPKGVEIASFIASGNHDLLHISGVAARLATKNVKVNDNCGLHVHADASDLSVDQVAVIVAYWLKIEPIISLALPVRRRYNEYCKPFLARCPRPVSRQHSYRPHHFWDLIAPDNLMLYENLDRRVTLNLVNYARGVRYHIPSRQTLELRWPEGTMDGVTIRGWVRLFLGFIEECKDRDMPKDLQPVMLEHALEYMGLGHGRNFYIFDEHLHETRTWFLERLLFYGSLMSNRKHLAEAKNILNDMWLPVKKYA